MSDVRLVILGAGGHAAVVVESAVRAGWQIAGIASREPIDARGPFSGAAWLGDPDEATVRARIESLVVSGARVHAAVGDGRTRERWSGGFGPAGETSPFAAVIDPTAIVSPSAVVAPGAFIGAGAIVQARALVSTGAIVNTRAVVEHDATVGAFAHVSPAAVLCGGVAVGAGAHVGAGTVVLPAKRIGDWAIVGAGAVVTRDVAAGATVVGVPARVIRA